MNHSKQLLLFFPTKREPLLVIMAQIQFNIFKNGNLYQKQFRTSEASLTNLGSHQTLPSHHSSTAFYHRNLVFSCLESFDLSPFNAHISSNPTPPDPSQPSNPYLLRVGPLLLCSSPLHSIGEGRISCLKENQMVKDTTPDIRRARLIVVYS